MDKIGYYKLGNMCVLVSCSLILTHKWLEESRAMKPTPEPLKTAKLRIPNEPRCPSTSAEMTFLHEKALPSGND